MPHLPFQEYDLYTVGTEVKFLTSAEVAIPAKFSLLPTGSMEGSQSDRAPSEPCPAPWSAQTHSINHGRIMHSGCACDKEWWSAEHRPGFACRFVHLYFSRATLRICRTWGGEMLGLGGGGKMWRILKNILIRFDHQTAMRDADREQNCRILRSQIPSRQHSYTRCNLNKGQPI